MSDRGPRHDLCSEPLLEELLLHPESEGRPRAKLQHVGLFEPHTLEQLTPIEGRYGRQSPGVDVLLEPSISVNVSKPCSLLTPELTRERATPYAIAQSKIAR
jgi:hypothetical protein